MVDDCLGKTDATKDQPESEKMSSDEDLDFPVVFARHWYKCNVCHGYVHSIPILRYHYLDEHGMTLSSTPQINGKPPPGAFEGKLYTSNWPPPLEPPGVSNAEEAASTSPASRPPEDVHEDEPLLIRVRNLNEVVESSSCSNNAEHEKPSPTDSGIQSDDASEVQEDDFQQPLPPPPTDQNQLNSLDTTDNRNTSNEQTISPTKTISTTFSCTICNIPYNSPSQLNSHIRTKHKYQVVRDSPEKTNSAMASSPPKIVVKIKKTKKIPQPASDSEDELPVPAKKPKMFDFSCNLI